MLRYSLGEGTITMDDESRNQLALLDAIYGAAIEPKDYLSFAKVWDETILKFVEGDEDASYSSHADASKRCSLRSMAKRITCGAVDHEGGILES
ncbi:MAG: hypothetical protein ABJ205_10610 [Erythrobacter sp.]|uniref:hypothetical protein n=1 Tax=Erythrobacter sp. TaxID=1042 RepID=UPI003265577C